MNGQRRTVEEVRQEAVNFLLNNCGSCTISEDKRTLSFHNIEITKSFCSITTRYPSRTDKYGNVYNYFKVVDRQNGVLTVSTVVLGEKVAADIEGLYEFVVNNMKQKTL